MKKWLVLILALGSVNLWAGAQQVTQGDGNSQSVPWFMQGSATSGGFRVGNGTGSFYNQTQSWFSGTTGVATAGTAIRLDNGTARSNPFGHIITIRALQSNSGQILVGQTAAIAQSQSISAYTMLWPGQAMYLDISTTANIFINSTANNEGVTYFLEVAP